MTILILHHYGTKKAPSFEGAFLPRIGGDNQIPETNNRVTPALVGTTFLFNPKTDYPACAGTM